MKLTSVDLLHSAVLVIDIQNDYCHQNGSMARAGNDVSLIQQMVPRLLKFLTEARQLEIPIIHVRSEHSKWTDSPSWRQRRCSGADLDTHAQPGSWGAEFYQVIPKPNEYVVTKHRYSAFIDTDLDLVLRSVGIRTIVLVGEATNVCVESTARDGFMKDYYVVVAVDCVAALDKRQHEASLLNIERHFGVVTKSQNLLEAWQLDKETSNKQLAEA